MKSNNLVTARHGRIRKILILGQLYFSIVSIVTLIVWGNVAVADTHVERDADTVLVVSGNISAESGDGIAFDMAALKKLPTTTITTDNPWIQGPAEFTGVRISTLLERSGAQSTDIEARAANEYKFKITDVDFDKYPIILAYKKNDEPMEFRDLGPLWIIFPFDDYPELLTSRNKAASVWQLTDIEVL